MKQLILSTAHLFLLVWPLCQLSAQQTHYQGFTVLSHTDKTSSISSIKNHLRLSDRHELKSMTHDDKRLQHYYDGYKVVNSMVVINPFGFGGSIHLFDELQVGFDLNQADALDLITSQLKPIVGSDMTATAVLFPSHKTIHSAYEVTIKDVADISRSETVFISATSGEILHREALAIPHNEPVIARSLYDGLIFTDVYREGDLYNMSHSNLDFRTFDLDGATHTVLGAEITGDQQIFQQKLDAVQAHYALGSTLDYYALRHGRESYDNEGSPVSAYVNFGDRSSNAFWTQGSVLLGGGDGTHYHDMAAVDIVGHEFTHGVIQHTADLRYSGESGALNESFADIFGEMSEFFARGKCDWQAGRQVALSNRVRFRSFRDPNSVNHPDTYQGQNWINPECGVPVGFNDFCGVHTNSSVQNKWFYILANGESGINDHGDDYEVIGISPNVAAAIAYKNLTEYLWTTSTFEDARQGAILAARELYGRGSIQEISTTNAWYAVGVGEPYTEVVVPEEQADTISPIELSIIDVSQHSIELSWSGVDTGIDTLSYDIILDGIAVVSTSDTAATLVDLTPNSSYDLLIRGYSDSVLVALSDTILVHTLAEEVQTGQLAAFYFEEGLDGWAVSSDDAAWHQGNFSPEGRGSIRLRDDYDHNMILSPWINTSSSETIDVSFSLYAWSVEFGEDLTIEYRGLDSTWHTIQSYRSRFDFRNDQTTPIAFSLEGIELSQIQFRVFLDASANTDHVYIDEFVVANREFIPSVNALADDVKLWPNPVAEMLNVNIGQQPSTIQVFDLSGQVVLRRTQQSGLISIDLSTLQSGLYHVEIITGDQYLTYPIVKE